MPQRFEDNSHIRTRALQAYLVLIGLAWHRQTITYGQLSQNQMEKYGHGGILAGPLNCIMGWCHESGLPPLTALVVNEQTGLPGEGLYTASDYPATQQQVFEFNWYSLFPPSPDELAAAGERAGAGKLRVPR
jgi:hypothetical protein